MTKHIAVDCRGLDCPGPVLRSKEAVEADGPLTLDVTVDNEAARQNVARFLQGKRYAVTVEETEAGLVLHAKRAGAASAEAPSRPGDACAAVVGSALGEEQIVVFVTAETMGSGDDALGGKLMANFLATLPELGDRLWRVILVNGAVKMATAGHPALDRLRALTDAGVSLLVCGTCLDHFGLLAAKQLGETTNMLDVVTSLQLASKVIQV